MKVQARGLLRSSTLMARGGGGWEEGGKVGGRVEHRGGRRPRVGPVRSKKHWFILELCPWRSRKIYNDDVFSLRDSFSLSLYGFASGRRDLLCCPTAQRYRGWRRKRNRVDAAATVDNKDDCGLCANVYRGKRSKVSKLIRTVRCPISRHNAVFFFDCLLIRAIQPSNRRELFLRLFPF